MKTKIKKKFHECIWYRYDFDDFGKYHICEKDCTRCEFGGVIRRQACPQFKSNPYVFDILEIESECVEVSKNKKMKTHQRN